MIKTKNVCIRTTKLLYLMANSGEAKHAVFCGGGFLKGRADGA
jgi:hypothetical protein